jgi:hypothetical protein
MYKILILSILLLICFSIDATAAIGCQRDSNLDVYTNPPSGWNEWTTAVRENCPSGSTTSDQYANVTSYTTFPATVCYIGFLGWTGAGKLVNYSILNCPIDDYIPYLVLIISVFSYFFCQELK